MKAAALLLLLVALCSCAPRPRGPQAPALAGRIALLPPSNESLDVAAPAFVRARLERALSARGFALMDRRRVDAALKRLGVSEGGQLGAFAPAALGEALGADVLCYGEIRDYGFRSALVLSQRRVELALRFVDARGGQTLWEGVEHDVRTAGGSEAVGELAFDTAGKVVKGLKAFDVVADVELRRETDAVLRKLLDAMRADLSGKGPGAG